MSVSGSFTTAAPLLDVNRDITADVISYGFLDGINTLTDANSSGTFLAQTDASGNVVRWDVRISEGINVGIGGARHRISTIFNQPLIGDGESISECTQAGFPDCMDWDPVAAGTIPDSPGTWNIVPIPPALLLFGSALGFLAFIPYRRNRVTN